MSRSANKVPVVKVALNLPRDVPGLLTRARLILTRMTKNNQWFPKPYPPLTVLQSAIDALHRAQVDTLSTKGVAARDKKQQDLKATLEQLAVYVETIANANLENAFAIIQAAGMFVKNTRGRSAVIFHAELIGPPFVIRVYAPMAANRAAYEFQYRLDGDETWLPFPQPATDQARATLPLPGVPRGTVVHLQYRATVKGVTRNWSQEISITLE